MAIDRTRDYRIRNQSQIELDVPGQVLLERALANEPDVVIEGGQEVPLREFVRQNVDVEDTIAKAHDQSGVQIVQVLPDAKDEAKRIAEIRDAEVKVAAGSAAANPEDDNLQDEAGDVLDNRDLDQDSVPDRLEDSPPFGE